MTLYSCLLLTFSHAKKCPSLRVLEQQLSGWMEEQAVYIRYYRFLMMCCFGALPKLRFPCGTVKTYEIVLTTKSFQSELVRQRQKRGRRRSGWPKVTA